MKKTIWKCFFNYEKEEVWLNEMSAKGLALIDFFLCRYSFADSVPGEFTYRIELLKHLPSHPESKRYIDFMIESGAEHVSSWHRWVYFRKKSEHGAFNIFSDIDSRISHYKRIRTLFLSVGIMEMLIGCGQLPIIFDGYLSGKPLAWYLTNLIALVLCWGLGVAILFIWNSVRKKTRTLKQEKNVWE